MTLPLRKLALCRGRQCHWLSLDIWAGVVIAHDATVDSDVVLVRDLSPVARAATLVHAGAMDSVAQSFAVLDEWIDAAGEKAVGFGREVYLDCPEDKNDWITELQFILA